MIRHLYPSSGQTTNINFAYNTEHKEGFKLKINGCFLKFLMLPAWQCKWFGSSRQNHLVLRNFNGEISREDDNDFSNVRQFILVGRAAEAEGKLPPNESLLTAPRLQLSSDGSSLAMPRVGSSNASLA